MESCAQTVFPHTQRVIYKKNPLLEVICQLRFPTILRIEAEPPASFQERLRAHYPVLREKRAAHLPPLSADIQAQLAQVVGKMFSERTGYDFVSADEHWTVGLTKDFVALSTDHYERWEDFRARLEVVLDALRTVYEPAFFTRVGLRYRNAIPRSALGKEAAVWTNLLRPHVLGEISSTDVAKQVVERRSTTVLDIPGQGRVTLQTGLGRTEEDDQEVFIIDADFFNDSRSELSDATTRLNEFNRESGCLFRWCITEKLHESMEPEPVS